MPPFRVNIDGRIYEGNWRTPTNAVFGAMRKDENDANHEIGLLSPWMRKNEHASDCQYPTAPYGVPCTCHIMQEYTDARKAYTRERKQMLIGVEEITDRKVAKKVHRVNEEG